MLKTAMKPQRRQYLIWGSRAAMALGSAALLSACGFKLRQDPDYPFQTVLINGLPNSALVKELQSRLEAGGKVQVVRDVLQPAQAQVVLDLLTDQREKVAMVLDATGQVREYQLRIRVRFKVRNPQGDELMAPVELLQQRIISYNTSQALAEESVVAMTYKSMQSDVVGQILLILSKLSDI
jgi:LPS-assembly lipoprotein